MIKIIVTLCISIVVITFTHGQTYRGKNGKVKFFSDAPLEDIEAVSNETNSVFKPSTGEVAVLIPIKSFKFDKALMREHFNQTYLESDKYPEATFIGKLKDKIDENTPIDKVVMISGKISIHGVVKDRNIQVTLKSGANGLLTASGKFMITLTDHKIKVPRLVFQNIAEVIEVSFELNLSQMDQ